MMPLWLACQAIEALVRRKYRDSCNAAQFEQVMISRNDNVGVAFNCDFDELVIVRIGDDPAHSSGDRRQAANRRRWLITSPASSGVFWNFPMSFSRSSSRIGSADTNSYISASAASKQSCGMPRQSNPEISTFV